MARGQKLSPVTRDRLRRFIANHPLMTAREIGAHFNVSRETAAKHRTHVLGRVVLLTRRPPPKHNGNGHANRFGPAVPGGQARALDAAKNGDEGAKRFLVALGLRRWWVRDGGEIL